MDNDCRMVPEKETKRFGLAYGNLQEALDIQSKLLEKLNIQLAPMMKDVPNGAELVKGDSAKEDRSEWTQNIDGLRYRVNTNNDELRRFVGLLEI